MNEAQHWLRFCQAAAPSNNEPSREHPWSPMECRWSRGFLKEMAGAVEPIGLQGLIWKFSDGSALISHPGQAPVLIASPNPHPNPTGW
jgi:hypothetical protein